MDSSDEKAVNKILQSNGLPNLGSVEGSSGNTGPDPSSNNDVTDLFPMANGAAAEEGNAQVLGMDLQFSPTDLALNTSFQNVGAPADAMSFGDWSQSYFDDSTTPDWLWAGMLAPDADNLGDQALINAAWNPMPIPNPEESQQHDDADPEIVNQISARFGSLQLAPDGKLRYFGTPANAHVLNSNRLWAPPANQRTLKSDGIRLLRNAELDLKVGQEFEEHLTKIFFSWHNSCHPVVDEAMYWSLKAQREGSEESSGFSSQVLTSAMYGSLISTFHYV